MLPVKYPFGLTHLTGLLTLICLKYILTSLMFYLPDVGLVCKPVAMDNRLQLQLILLLLFVTVCRGQDKKREITYNFLAEGQQILGQIGAQFKAESSQECGVR